MRAIREKLRSETGASITFALLLFLVCAVVGSVVLAAGTAAAGRLSQQVESDQRYYSVSSAARLLQTEIEDLSVTKTVTTPSSGVPETKYEINGQEVSSPTGVAALVYEAAQMNLPDITGEGAALTSLNITAQIDTTAVASLAVTVTGKLMSDGRLILEVSNTTAAATDDQYTQRLTFTLDQQTVNTTNAAQGSTSAVTRMTWTLYDVETIMRAATT